MRQTPPENLVRLLDGLRLATPGEVAAVERRARRLARGVPMFTSVWVDALVQAGRLTPFQAAEINTQRGEQLHAGPYVLFRKLPGLGYADVYEASHVETGSVRRLAVFTVSDDRAEETARRLEGLVAASVSLPREGIAPMETAGHDGTRLWAACDAPCGSSAAEWMIRHGRFPADAVLEIARRMMPGLIALEKAGLCHGDLRAATLLLTGGGVGKIPGAWLPFPGLRAAVRPREGYAHADLPPEAFDGLAPERVRDGTPPDVPGEIFACGCLWWHLLTGRDPLPGGDALTKLQAAQQAAVADPQPLAPEAPETLLKAIRLCTQALPEKRPHGMAELASILGPATREGDMALRRLLTSRLDRTSRRYPFVGRRAIGRRWKIGLAVAAACLLMVFVVIRLHGFARRDRDATAVLSNNANDTSNLASVPAQKQTTTQNRVARQNRAATVRERSSVATAPSRSRLGFSEKSRLGSSEESKRPPITRPSNLSELSTGVSPLILAADDPMGISPVARLPLTAGQRVQGPSGKRATLNVAAEGLSIDVPGVVFENIDFVRPSFSARADSTAPPALLVLRASGVELRGCTFRSADPSIDAVRWIHPSAGGDTALSLPSGRVTIDRCIFRNVAAAVDCRARGAVAVRFSNVLHLGAGPLVRLVRLPSPDEPTILVMDQTTLRDGGSLVQCNGQPSGSVGKLSIETSRCVFAPRPGQPLVVLAGKSPSDAVLNRIVWTGQGSLVTPGCPIAGLLNPSGELRELPEDALAIDGLVRSEVDFAGDAAGRISNSAAVHWLAPLKSDASPGIHAANLPE